MGEAADCGVLQGAMHQRSWMLERPPGCYLRGHRGLALEKQPTLQEPRAGETLHGAQWASGEAVCAVRAAEPGLQTQREGCFPTAMSLQCSLLTKLGIVPTGKGKLLKGLRSISAEQVVKGEFGAET